MRRSPKFHAVPGAVHWTSSALWADQSSRALLSVSRSYGGRGWEGRGAKTRFSRAAVAAGDARMRRRAVMWPTNLPDNLQKSLSCQHVFRTFATRSSSFQLQSLKAFCLWNFSSKILSRALEFFIRLISLLRPIVFLSKSSVPDHHETGISPTFPRLYVAWPRGFFVLNSLYVSPEFPVASIFN